MKKNKECNLFRGLKAVFAVLFFSFLSRTAEAQNLRLLKISAEGLGEAQLGVSLDPKTKNVSRLFYVDAQNHWYAITTDQFDKPMVLFRAKIRGVVDKNVLTAVGHLRSNEDIEMRIGFLRNALTDSESDREWFPIRILYNRALGRYQVWDLRSNEVVTRAKAVIHRSVFIKVGIDDFVSE